MDRRHKLALLAAAAADPRRWALRHGPWAAARQGALLALLLGPLGALQAAESVLPLPVGVPLGGSPVAEEPPEPLDDNTTPWQPEKVKRGIRVSRRPVASSRYFEYRAVITVPLPPQQVIDQVWHHLATVKAAAVKSRQLLRHSPTDILVYDQIHSPVVTDRDYTLALHRIVDAEGRTLRLRFESANQLGPPPSPQFVRVPVIRGSWTVESEGSSGTRLTHRNFSEPGGSIPAFLVHGPQCDQVIDSMVQVAEQLRQIPPPSTATAAAPSRQL